MTVVGTAWVTVKVVTRGLDSDIKDAVERALKNIAPDVQKASKDVLGPAIGKGITDGVSEHLNSELADEVETAFLNNERAVHDAARDTLGDEAGRGITTGITDHLDAHLENDTRQAFQNAEPGIHNAAHDLGDGAGERAGRAFTERFFDHVDRETRNKSNWENIHRNIKKQGKRLGETFGKSFTKSFFKKGNGKLQVPVTPVVTSNTQRGFLNFFRRFGKNSGVNYSKGFAAGTDDGSNGIFGRLRRTFTRNSRAQSAATARLGDDARRSGGFISALTSPFRLLGRVVQKTGSIFRVFGSIIRTPIKLIGSLAKVYKPIALLGKAVFSILKPFFALTLLLGKGLVLIQGAGYILGAATIGFMSLGRAVAGLGLAALPVLAAVGGAVAVFALAFKDKTKYLDAFQKKTKGLAEDWRKIRIEIQKRFLPSLGDAVQIFRKLSPTFKKGLGGLATDVGNFIKDFAKRLTSPRIKKSFENIFAGLRPITRSLGKGFTNIAESLVLVVEAALPLGQSLGGAFDKVTARWLTAARDTDGLRKRFDSFRVSLGNWRTALGNFWTGFKGILSAPAKSVGGFEKWLVETSRDFRDWVNNPANQGKLAGFFSTAKTKAKELFDTLGQVASVIGTIATADPSVFSNLLTVIGDVSATIIANKDGINTAIAGMASFVTTLGGALEKLGLIELPAKEFQTREDKPNFWQRNFRFGAREGGAMISKDDITFLSQFQNLPTDIGGLKSKKIREQRGLTEANGFTKEQIDRIVAISFQATDSEWKDVLYSVNRIREDNASSDRRLLNKDIPGLDKYFGPTGAQTKAEEAATKAWDALKRKTLATEPQTGELGGGMFKESADRKPTDTLLPRASRSGDRKSLTGVKASTDATVKAGKDAATAVGPQVETAAKQGADAVTSASKTSADALKAPTATATTYANTLGTQLPGGAALAAAGIAGVGVTASGALTVPTANASTYSTLLGTSVPASASLAATGVVDAGTLMAGAFAAADQGPEGLALILSTIIPDAAIIAQTSVILAGLNMQESFVGTGVQSAALGVKILDLSAKGRQVATDWASINWNGLWTAFASWAAGTWSQVTETLLKPFRDFKSRVTSIFSGWSFTTGTLSVTVPVTITYDYNYVNQPPVGTAADSDNGAPDWRPGQGGVSPVLLGSRFVSPTTFGDTGPAALGRSLGASIPVISTHNSNSSRTSNSGTYLTARDRAYIKAMKEGSQATPQEVRVFIGDTELTRLVTKVQTRRDSSLRRQISQRRGGV